MLFSTMILLGLMGLILNSSNLLQLFISFELMSMGLMLLFGYSSLFYFSIYPLMISMLLVVISAAEMALGLTLIIYLKKMKGSINLEKFIYVH